MDDYSIEITPNKPISDDEYIKHLQRIYSGALAPLADSITKTYDDMRATTKDEE